MATTESSGDYNVPLGWVALLAGIVVCAAAILSKVGLAAKTDYPITGLGLALVVGGYIACFIIPPLHHRVSTLERRLTSLEDRQPDNPLPKSNDNAT